MRSSLLAHDQREIHLHATRLLGRFDLGGRNQRVIGEVIHDRMIGALKLTLHCYCRGLHGNICCGAEVVRYTIVTWARITL